MGKSNQDIHFPNTMTAPASKASPSVEELLEENTRLRVENERLLFAAELARVSYWRWSFEDESMTYWSSICADFFGTVESAVPKTPDDMLNIVHPDDYQRLQQVYIAADEGAKSNYTVEFRVVHANGEIRHIREMAECEYNGKGDVIAHIGICQDITELKKVEEALIIAQDELLNQERFATIGQFTATVSHELRNPMASMRASLFVISDIMGGRNEKLDSMLTRVNRNLMRCDRIIDELLDYAEVRELQLVEFKINAWLEDVLSEQEFPPEVSLKTDLGTDVMVARADGERLRRALVNVLDNAGHALSGQGSSKSRPANPTLTISTKLSSRGIEIVLSDNGAGMSPDALKNIFKPLYSTKGFGTGLGLSSVKQILEQHGGGVEIDSTEAKGTQVTLWLPGDSDL